MTDPALKLTREQLLQMRATIDAMLLGGDQAPHPKPPPMPSRLTIRSYAERQNVSVSTVRRWIRAGLPHTKLSPRIIRIDPNAADEWIRRGGDRGRPVPLSLVSRDP